MKPFEKPCIITISHQIGSGGAVIGQKLSERLCIPFFDREILKRVAAQLNLAESALEHRQERLSSFWNSLARITVFTDPAECLAPEAYIPSDRDLFRLESENIGRIAENSSAIFLGRCGRYILRDHPRHLRLLVHADLPARVQRVSQLYCLSAWEAEKLIKANDKERSAYIRAFTKENWLDPHLYDVCLNTSTLGLERSVEVVLSCAEEKFRE